MLSPGPCTPKEAGICLDLIAQAAATIPILGVCLGHQAIGDAFGGKVVRAPVPVHGKLSEIRHEGRGIFRGINAPFKATRYHSLVVERDSMPAELAVTADTDDGLVMGLAHTRLPVHGVQFHPESIASEHGHLMLKNFLDIAAAWNASTGGGAAAAQLLQATSIEDRAVTVEFRALIGKVATGADARAATKRPSAFEQMMSGEATPSQMGALLMALRVRGETVDEITGAVTAMRAKMLRVEAPPDAIDVVGTGGDASGSFNISTCAALIVAGAGVPVAKHGNRALSSRSGAADVLAALGVNIDLNPEQIGHCIREAGIGFMFAPAHHPATKNVSADPRRTRHPHDLQSARSAVQSGRRAAADGRRVLAAMDRAAGASAEESRRRKRLGGARLRRARRDHDVRARPASRRSKPAWCADSRFRRKTSASTRSSRRRCAAATRRPMPRRSRRCSRASKVAFRDVALFNAAAALVVAGKAKDLKAGLDLAAHSVDSGEAEGRLDRLIVVSNDG